MILSLDEIQGEKMKKILWIMICFMNIMFAKVDVHTPVSLAGSLEISAEMMNKTLPMMVDAELRHDKVEVDGNTMTLKFTLVNFTKEEMSAQKLKLFIEEDIRHNVCEDVDSQMMLLQGMKIIYDYVDKNNKHITQFIYDDKVCELENDREEIKENILDIADTNIKK